MEQVSNLLVKFSENLAYLPSTVQAFPESATRLHAYFERLVERPSVRQVIEDAAPYFPLYPYADAIPKPDWLLRLRQAADSLPAYDVLAGTVRPSFTVPPPSWLLAAARAGPTFARL